MAVDKMMLICRLLRTPFCDETAFIPFFKNWKKPINDVVMDVEKMRTGNLSLIYEFYYGNLLPVFEYLRAGKNREETNQIFVLIYHFLASLRALYSAGEPEDVHSKIQSEEEQKYSRNCAYTYMMTVSGIVNAAMESGLPDVIDFCCHILSCYCLKQKFEKTQLGLFFLYQEHLDSIGKNEVELSGIQNVKGFCDWKLKIGDIGVYRTFWEIWMRWSMDLEYTNLHFRYAIDTMDGCSFASGSILYFRMLQKRKRERGVLC